MLVHKANAGPTLNLYLDNLRQKTQQTRQIQRHAILRR